jgi:hypothetical protein
MQASEGGVSMRSPFRQIHCPEFGGSLVIIIELNK